MSQNSTAAERPWYRQPQFIVAAIAVVIAFLGYREYTLNNVGTKHELVGSDAPAFEMPNMGESQMISIDDYRGKVVLLDFWATWCIPCKRQVPTLRSIHGRYGGDDFVLIAVNTDEEAPNRRLKVSRYIESAHLDVLVPFDDNRTQVLYGVKSIPTMVLIGKDGKVKRVFRGVTSRGIIERAIKRELAAN